MRESCACGRARRFSQEVVTVATVAKYLGDGSRFYNGVPAKDLTEEEFEALPDEAKATLAATPPEGVKPLYRLSASAPKEAAAAERRVEKATAEETAPTPPPPAATTTEAKK